METSIVSDKIVLAKNSPVSTTSDDYDRKSISPNQTDSALSGPPPPIPRRNRGSIEGNANGPPKLPPKPEESPKPKLASDLRNQKTLVLPDLGEVNGGGLSPRNVF